MSSKILSRQPPVNPITLESLIEDLDQRGLLVFLVLLGQQAMKILSEEHSSKVTSSKILVPSTSSTSVSSTSSSKVVPNE